MKATLTALEDRLGYGSEQPVEEAFVVAQEKDGNIRFAISKRKVDGLEMHV